MAERFRRLLVGVVREQDRRRRRPGGVSRASTLRTPSPSSGCSPTPSAWIGEDDLLWASDLGANSTAVARRCSATSSTSSSGPGPGSSGATALAEAWRRRQVDREPSERAAEMLLGLDLGPALVDRGSDFVRGVVERAGDEGWPGCGRGATLPTPSELDAPGLWLERISLG